MHYILLSLEFLKLSLISKANFTCIIILKIFSAKLSAMELLEQIYTFKHEAI